MPKAFVSYCRDDSHFVESHVRTTLTALGIDMWIDTQNLHGAEQWEEAIRRAMPECDYFLLVVTNAAAASPSVRAEVNWILENREETLIPILASRTRLDGIHPKLPSIQHIDCVDKTPGRTATLLARGFLHLADRRSRVLQEQKRELSAKIEELSEELEEGEAGLNRMSEQLEQILTFDGDWRRPALGSVPPFISRSERNAPVVAVMNLKGGVGKSTLAGNLAAMWWGRPVLPKRVLLVDLDFQQSVTSLCLSARDLDQLHDADLFVNSLFDERVDGTAHLLRSMRRVGRGDGFVIASNEALTRVETQIMARWLTQQTQKDVRYLLRELLQGPAVQGRFDLIVVDCPPRIHTASINALAAADFILVPVLLDLTSADSVPRFLRWIRTYQAAGVCPNAEILGIVANKKSDRRVELLIREENIWRNLQGKCRLAWGGDVPFCEAIVPNNAAIAECSQTPGRFASEDARVRPIFEKLVKELETQMANELELA